MFLSEYDFLLLLLFESILFSSVIASFLVD